MQTVALDIVYTIINQLVLPTHPLAYSYDPTIRTTLRSFLLVCKGTYDVSSKLLYSRVCVESISQLHQLCLAPSAHLNSIRSLYIRLDRPVNESIYRFQTRDSLRLLANLLPSLSVEAIISLKKSICYLLQSVHPSLQRLAISIPRSPELEDGNRTQQRAIDSFWDNLYMEIRALLPNLIELAVIGHDPNGDLILFHDVQGPLKLRRLCVCSELNALGLPWPSMPALEQVSFFAHMVDAEDLVEILEPIDSITTALVYSSVSSKHLHETELAELQQWAQSLDHPIELVLKRVGLEDVCLEIQRMVRSGLFWDAHATIEDIHTTFVRGP